MKLIDVYGYNIDPAIAVDHLYALLAERQPHESISHRSMPTREQHFEFVRSMPYAAWYVFEGEDGGILAGSVYLTRQREIGVSVLRAHQGQGHGRRAVLEIMRRHAGGHFLANINPANEASIALFRKLGFGGPIQITLEKP